MISAERLLIKIGEQIRYLRRERGVSAQDLAAACNFETSNMSRIEAGKTNLTVKTLYKIAYALDVSVADLVNVE